MDGLEKYMAMLVVGFTVMFCVEKMAGCHEHAVEHGYESWFQEPLPTLPESSPDLDAPASAQDGEGVRHG